MSHARLKELQEKRSTLVAQARERFDLITANTDESRAAELEASHDAAMAAFDTNEREIERVQRQMQIDGVLSNFEQRQRERRRPNNDQRGEGDAGDDETVSYRDAFHAYLRAEGQIAMLSAEQRSVLQSGYQALTPEQRALVTGTTTAGGFTVPTELQDILIRTMKLWGPMYDPGITSEIVTSHGHSFPFPTIDDTANTGAATTQGTTLTDDGSGDPVFGQKALGAFAFATPWVRVSKELADDSVFAMEALLGDLLGERLGRLANGQLTTGVGTTAPSGIVTASTAGKTAASATAFTYDEVIDLEHSVDAAYRQSPKFRYMFHDLVLAALRKLKDGQGNYLWQAGNVQAGVPNQLNGKPYSINNGMSSAFTTGQKLILAGDFGKYYVRKVGAPLIGAIQDKDFWPGFGVAGWIRFDGNLLDTAAVKHLKLA